MQKIFSRFFLTAATVFSATLMLNACGDDSSSSPTQGAISDQLSSSSVLDTQSSNSEDAPASSETAESSSGAKPASSATSSATPTSSAASSATTAATDWREYCLEVVNKYRATENLKVLALAPEAKQTCTDNQAAADLQSNKAHGHFGDCGEYAQNSAPNITLSWLGTEAKIVDYYLEMMWNEKKLIESGERDPNKDSDYSYIGHYLNMSSTKYSTVSCGFAKSSDGKTGWMNVNFYY